MQFIITAYDGTDEGALDRRMSVRQAHLDNMAKVQETCTVVCAGGITDENGRMIGSFLIMDFETKEQFDEYMASEPYIANKVWETVRVECCNVVILNNQRVGK